MPKLLEKSDLNIEAAQILIYEHQLYAPSIHCCYYACFQRIKFELKKHLGFNSNSYKEFDKLMEAKGKSSHKNLFALLNKELKTINATKFDISYINSRLEDLMSARKKSDYYPDPISEVYSKEILKKSKITIDKLEKIFVI